MRVKIKAKRLTVVALSVSLAMIFSFVESQIPPLAMVPGVKIGLANIVTVFLLYSLGLPEAVLVSFIRVVLSSILFGNMTSFIYSIAGAVLSIITMLIAKNITPLGKVGVSVVGALAHNAGQVIAACIVMGTAALSIYYLPLIITGTLSGAVIGVIAGIVTKRVTKFLNPDKQKKKKADRRSAKKKEL